MDELNRQFVKKNSVVQVIELGPPDWVGCLMQVDEVRSWGVQAWVKIPKSGDAYLRLNWEQIELIGQAVLSPE